MTAPVTITENNNDLWTMSFSMPSKYTLDNLPKPNDKRISIETTVKKTFAVITYSGSWNEKRNMEKAELLKSWIVNKSDYKITSQAIYAGYNPPWTIPMFKKNEAFIEVSP